MSTFATRFAKIFPGTKFIDIMKTSSNLIKGWFMYKT